MKKNGWLLILFALPILLYSCYSDDTSEGQLNSPLDEIVSNTIEDEYVIDAHDEFVLAPPVFNQGASPKTLTYRWSINGNVVSESDTLRYTFDQSAVYSLLLIVSNGEDAYTKRFAVNVRYPYGLGLYALASLNGEPILSYEPDVDFNSVNYGRTFQQDIFRINNPGLITSTQPLSMTITNTTYAEQYPFMYIALGTPSKLYRVNQNNMVVIQEIDTFGDEVQLIRPHFALGEMNYFVQDLILNNRFARLRYNGSFITNSEQQAMESRFGTLSLSTDFVTVLTESGDEDYTLFFDNNQGRVIAWQYSNYSEILPSTFNGSTLVAMLLANNKVDAVSITKDASSILSLNWFHASSSGGSAIKHTETGSASLSENGVYRSAPTRNLLFYSKGNDVYVYNITSQSALPTSPQFTCGTSAETIVDMWITPEENRIYIATNNPSESLSGSLYCYDALTYTPIWEKKNVTGEIKTIQYRIR